MYDNNFRLEGIVHERFDSQQVTETFRKREFILEVMRSGNSNITDMVKFQCVQQNITLLDEVRIGNRVLVNFQVTGREWNSAEGKRYFTNLDCIDIDILDATNTEESGDILAKDIDSTVIPEGGFPQEKKQQSSGEDWLSGKKSELDPEEHDDLPF